MPHAKRNAFSSLPPKPLPECTQYYTSVHIFNPCFIQRYSLTAITIILNFVNGLHDDNDDDSNDDDDDDDDDCEQARHAKLFSDLLQA